MTDSGPQATRRVWWSYLGQTYGPARRGGYLWAPGDPSHRLGQVRPGDLVVHENRRRIAAVSRILSEPWRVVPPAGAKGDPAGQWLVRAEYTDLLAPLPFLEIREELRRLEPPDGPMHQEIGSGKPGDLYRFNQAGLDLVLRVTETELR